MATETLAPAGFSVECGPPRGEVQEGGKWPCIAYDVRLTYEGREVWKGAYRLGVGHVKPKQLPWTTQVPQSHHDLSAAWAVKPGANFMDKKLWAEVAAMLAKLQKVQPKLDDVLYSLLSDGSAFFDAISHEEWCGDLGFDPDSIKGKAMYDACFETGRRFVAVLGAEKVDELRELYQDY